MTVGRCPAVGVAEGSIDVEQQFAGRSDRADPGAVGDLVVLESVMHFGA